MPLISEQLNNLRNEITVLKNQNVSFLEQKDHSAIDKSEAESRARRLGQIKQELSKLLTKPVSSAWW